VDPSEIPKQFSDEAGAWKRIEAPKLAMQTGQHPKHEQGEPAKKDADNEKGRE